MAAGVAGDPCSDGGRAVAQDISINFGQGGGLTERVIQLIALLTVLSLAPSILIMMTSFTRIVVVLSLLRTALGTATAPPNAVIVALALFLTAFVMGPALQRAYDAGIRPLINNEISVEQAFERCVRAAASVFMQKNVREKDLAAVHRPVARAAPGHARGPVAAHPGAGLHDLRAEARLRDRLPAVPAVPDHRPGGRLGADVDGHDDAAAGGGVAAVQADLLRAGGRLEPGRRLLVQSYGSR